MTTIVGVNQNYVLHHYLWSGCHGSIVEVIDQLLPAYGMKSASQAVSGTTEI